MRSLTKNERCEQIAQMLTKNEQPWAICSGGSPKNKRMSESLVFWTYRPFAHCLLIFSQKTSDSLRTPMSELPTLSIRSEKKAVSSIRQEEVVLSIRSEAASWVFGQRRRFWVPSQRRQFWVLGQRRPFWVLGQRRPFWVLGQRRQFFVWC